MHLKKGRQTNMVCFLSEKALELKVLIPLNLDLSLIVASETVTEFLYFPLVKT